jgi:4,5-dihydroxyphthalate decarboxylase
MGRAGARHRRLRPPRQRPGVINRARRAATERKQTDMSKLQISLAISDYDHVRDFVDGRVVAEGLDINFQILPTPEIFDRATRDQEWDVCEMSLGKFTGMFSQGDDSLVPIPVFPSRVFRHSALYVRKGGGVDTLAKLAGKRVGDPDFAHTAGIYARGYLMHDVGIELKEIEWVQAGTNKPGRHENLEINLPSEVRRVSVPDKTLDEMLLAGEIDAILSAIPPKSFVAGHPAMVRLVPNYVEVEADYFRRTGIFPIMHFVAIKRELFERHKWMAVNLYKAFEEAKERSVARIKDMMVSHFPLPWNPDNARRAVELFGPDFWPYGVAPNRKTLEAFLTFAFEQGVAHRPVALDELFPSSVQRMLKV